MKSSTGKTPTSARIALPRERGRPWKQGDVIWASFIVGGSIAFGSWAGAAIADMQALERRLSRTPEGDRIWGAAVLETDPQGRGLCRFEGRDNEGDVLWSRHAVLASAARLGDRVLSLSDGVELLDVSPERLEGAGAQELRQRLQLDSRGELHAECVGAEVYLDGCVGSDETLTGCDGEPWRAVRGASAEPLVRRASRYVPLALGLAAPVWMFTLGMLLRRSAAAGRSAWALARRAGLSARLDALVTHGMWRSLQASAVVLVLGAALTAADAPRRVQALTPAALALLVLAALGVVLGRITTLRLARRFIQRLHTAALSQLSADERDIELALHVPPDTPTLELPFLEGRFACVQLRYGEHLAHVRTWPERLTLRDGTGSAELALDAFEICGWRSKHDVTAWTEKRPPIVDSLEQAVGAPVVEPKSSTLSWTVWGLLPGDAVYVVGEAKEVRRGFGSYRGSSAITLGSKSEMPAVAIVGDEAALDRTIDRELRHQSAVALLALGALAFLALAVAHLVA